MIFCDNYPNTFALKSKMRYFFISVLSIVLLASCSTDETVTYEVGSDFIDKDILVRVIDTFSIKAGTFKLDSIATSSTNRVLLGNVLDDNLGQLTAKSYLELTTSTFSINTDAVYDSIGLILNYDKYYYGDTTKIQTYNVHRVLQTIEPDEGTIFYNTSSFNYDSESLGELSFLPKPNKSTDSLYIPLKNTLGEEIFNKIVDNDINNSDDFLQYFKGITIIPDTTTTNNVLGFNVSTTANTTGNSSVRLYYTIKDDDNEDNSYFIDFVISDLAKQFNQINTDLTTSSVLGSFEDGEEIKNSTDTNNLIFAEGGTGISARIEIPAIKKLLEISNTASALSAELTFTPLESSYSNNNPLEENLIVFIVDHKNRIISQLTDADGNTVNAILNKDGSEFNSDTHYTIDLIGFVEQILQSDLDLNYALMLQYTDYTKTVKNLVIENNTENQIKLSVKYLNY